MIHCVYEVVEGRRPLETLLLKCHKTPKNGLPATYKAETSINNKSILWSQRTGVCDIVTYGEFFLLWPNDEPNQTLNRERVIRCVRYFNLRFIHTEGTIEVPFLQTQHIPNMSMNKNSLVMRQRQKHILTMTLCNADPVLCFVFFQYGYDWVVYRISIPKSLAVQPYKEVRPDNEK